MDGKTLYEQAILGFPNYWYPACLSKEVAERPKAMTLLGDPIAFLRRNGKAYALANECPHRGTRLSRGKYEFPGTNTLSCRYHGWTFDVTTGTCVAALTDGPDSPVVGKVRVRTYPVEERKGILWIWMGRTAPVPLEKDAPKLLLRKDTCVHTYRRVVHGDWRIHAENVGAGHAEMLHRDSLYRLFLQTVAHSSGFQPVVDSEGEDSGEWVLDRVQERVFYENYPGLGQWPRPRPWRRPSVRKYRTLFGLRTKVAIRLPGLTRTINFPLPGTVFYEWYVPMDKERYLYFQVPTHHPRNPLEAAWYHLYYYLWARPTGVIRFNAQDIAMVPDATAFARRHGSNVPSPPFRPDAFPLLWRSYCNQRARGNATPPAEALPLSQTLPP